MSDGKKAPIEELRELAARFINSDVIVGNGRYLTETLNGIADDLDALGYATHAHNFALIETVRKKRQESGGLVTWIRIDRFYCKVCLEQQERRHEEQSESQPEWW